MSSPSASSSSPSSFSIPARNPSAGLAGVDGVLVVTSSPESSSRATTSVKVPPVSIPTLIRRVWPAAMARFNQGATRRSGVGRPVVVDPCLLLAGQLLDRGHDAVGDLTARLPGRYAVVRATDIDGLPELHGDAHQAGAVRADRLEPVRVQ